MAARAAAWVGAMVEGVMVAEELEGATVEEVRVKVAVVTAVVARVEERVAAARVAVERERSRVNRSSSPRCAEYGPAREARASRIRQQRPGS